MVTQGRSTTDSTVPSRAGQVLTMCHSLQPDKNYKCQALPHEASCLASLTQGDEKPRTNQTKW